MHPSPTPRSFAIVPAAGRSRRMGTPKLLLPWKGRTVLEATLAAWRASRVTHTVVVVHPQDQPLADLARALQVEVVQPATPPPEMKDSVRAALDFIHSTWQPLATDAWLLAPADLPLLDPRLIDALLAAYTAGPPRILRPEIRGRAGHPVLLPWRLAREVRQLGPDEGISALVARHAAEGIPWVADPAGQDDLDTPANYEKLYERFGRP